MFLFHLINLLERCNHYLNALIFVSFVHWKAFGKKGPSGRSIDLISMVVHNNAYKIVILFVYNTFFLKVRKTPFSFPFASSIPFMEALSGT